MLCCDLSAVIFSPRDRSGDRIYSLEAGLTYFCGVVLWSQMPAFLLFFPWGLVRKAKKERGKGIQGASEEQTVCVIVFSAVAVTLFSTQIF